MKRQMVEQWDAGYLRVSTDMQVERDALQNQIQALEAYAAAHGLRLRLYKDEGISAKDTHRPDLQRLLSDVRAGRVRSVLVTKLDRISRSLADLLDLMRLFEQHGVKFISLRDNIDTSGPVGRFMLHILGAIAELERAITAERVAEDMKLRAQRQKWNGGLAPYGRRMEDGQLKIVPDEAAVLRRMRELFLEKRSWLGVAVALNRAGFRTRGWEPEERDGRLVRKGHAPAEWTPTSVKRVLLQPINDGTLVYNRRRTKGKTAVARPAEEHVVVKYFCEPIFTPEQLDELRRVAEEIAGTPPGVLGSPHLLSGLIECACGEKMYGMYNAVITKRGRYRVAYYRCRRAMHKGTCPSKYAPAAVIEPVVVKALCQLGLDPERLRELAGEAQATFEAEVRPLLERREAATRAVERLTSRLDALLELAEDRLVTKEEFAARKARLEGERAARQAELTMIEAEIAARSSSVIDVEATARGLRRLGDVFDELEGTIERRALLATCLNRVVVRPGELELHVPAYSVFLVGDEASREVSDQLHRTAGDGTRNGAISASVEGEFPWGVSGANSENYGICRRMGVPAGTLATPFASASVAMRPSAATASASLAHCSTASICTSRCRAWPTRSWLWQPPPPRRLPPGSVSSRSSPARARRPATMGVPHPHRTARWRATRWQRSKRPAPRSLPPPCEAGCWRPARGSARAWRARASPATPRWDRPRSTDSARPMPPPRGYCGRRCSACTSPHAATTASSSWRARSPIWLGRRSSAPLMSPKPSSIGRGRKRRDTVGILWRILPARP